MGRSVVGWIGRLVSGRSAGLPAAALVVGVLWVAPAPAAAALTNLTWSGAGVDTSREWSNGGNWVGGTGPVASESLGTVTFPQVASCGGPTSCYIPDNDVSGLSANALSVVDTAGYAITGLGLALGGGGITAYPGSPPFANSPDVNWGIPLTLTADQDWSITGAGTGIYEGNLVLDQAVTGTGDTLGVQFANQAYLSDLAGIEAGAFNATGADSADTGVNADLNGTIFPASLNSDPAYPVSVTDVELGDQPNVTDQPLIDDIGPLTATGALLQVGGGQVPDGILAVQGGVTLNPGTVTQLEIDQGGSTPSTDYSQLTASGNITLGGTLSVAAGIFSSGACSSIGSTDTLITTSGTLSGTFANAPAGALVSFTGCPSLAARIGYTSNSVTATIVSGSGTSTTLSASPMTATTNQPVSLTATVTTGTPLDGGPAGTVEFLDGTTAIAGCNAQPVTAANGTTATATCKAAFGAAGSPAALTALYTPSSGSGLSSSASLPVSLSVSPAATSVTVSASSSTLIAGQSDTYTAHVAPADAGTILPTGTVSFADGDALIAGCKSQPVSASGVATCTATPASGSHTVSASYGGDGNFSGSASPAATVSVSVSAAPAGGTPAVGPPKTSGTSISIPVSCTGATSCTVTLTLTTTETLKGDHVIAVTAAKHKLKRKLVTVGRATATIAAGHAKTVKVGLNVTGRKLLTKEHTLPLKMTVTQSKRTLTTRTLTIKTKTGRTHTREHG